MKQSDIEEIRKAGYKKYPRYKYYVDKALESGNTFLSTSNSAEYVTEADFRAKCKEVVSQNVTNNVPKTGIFSWFFFIILESVISWVVKKLLDKYYGN